MSQHGVDRANAYLALPKVQIPTREAKALLKRGMSDLDAQVRAIAILSCETMRPIGIANILVAKLNDTDWRVRLAACRAVKALLREKSINSLRARIDDTDPHVAHYVCDALIELEGHDPIIAKKRDSLQLTVDNMP
jgi:hypothetical protein